MQVRSSIIILTFLCSIVFVNAQNIVSKKLDSIEKIESVTEKITAYTEVLEKYGTIANIKNLGTLYHELGTSYAKEETYDKAILFFKKAMATRSELKDATSYNYSRYRLARLYANIQMYKEEHALLENIINDLGTDIYTSYAHRLLGRIERENGDIPQSLLYLNLGLANKELLKTEKVESNLRYEIITTYAKKYVSIFKTNAEYFSDLKIINDHLKRLTVDDIAVGNIPILYNSLAAVYDVSEAHDKVLQYYKKAQESFRSTGDTYGELAAINNIAIVYSKQGKHELAKQYYDSVLNESEDEEQIATAWDNMGYYLPNATAKEKIPYFEKAIHTILERKTVENVAFTLPTLAEIKKSGYQLDMLPYLQDLALHCMQVYKDEQDASYLLRAKEVMYVIDNVVSYIRYTAEAETSKLFWIQRGVDLYMLAVEICYLLEDAEAAFYFMEKNKSLLLLENIRTLQRKLTSDIPDKTLEREYNLHYEILKLREQFQHSTTNDSLQKQYTVKNKEYQIFMDSLQRFYPAYAKTREEVTIVTLQDIIKTYKKDDTAFVEYILNEKDGYGIFYDGKDPIVFKIATIKKLQQQLKSLQAFTISRMDTKERKEFQRIGFQLFQQLFPFENALQRLQNKKIVIVPDHTLQYIPFEVLPTQKVGKLSEAYLINTTEISYLQSFSLFEQIQKKQNKPTKKLLAIAPVEFQNKDLQTLESETSLFASFTKETASLILQKTKATKENFLKYRNDFEIIHLNTHGGLDSISQTPWLAFHDTNITLNELYGLENQATMVVLDACKTNDGINISGEGIINLSRGFFYNGTQSVLASQWNVNEKAGNEILKTFYVELENGHSKSKALQLAKKAYLQKHEATQNVPYFWAAFKLTGDTKPIVQFSWFNTTTIIIGIVILLLLVVFFKYRKHIF